MSSHAANLPEERRDQCDNIFLNEGKRIHELEKQGENLRSSNIYKKKGSPTNKKTLECDMCGISYTYKSNLYMHIQTQHKVLKCEICSKQFTSVSALDVHIQSVHEDIEQNKLNLEYVTNPLCKDQHCIHTNIPRARVLNLAVINVLLKPKFSVHT